MFSPPKLRVAQLFLTHLDATKEVLKGQIEPFDGLLEGLGVGVLEKGIIPFQVFQAVVQVIPAEIRAVCFISGFFGFQGPVIDEPTGTGILVNAFTLSLVRVEAIPVGSQHESFFTVAYLKFSINPCFEGPGSSQIHKWNKEDENYEAGQCH